MMKPTKFSSYFASIIPDGWSIEEWRPDPRDPSKIIGTWAEDGSRYEIICPPQLRGRLLALQNILPQIEALVFYGGQRKSL